MKRMKYVLTALALLTSISVLASETPQEGIDRGNGGQEVAQSFVDLGYELVESLMKDPVAGVDTNALYTAVQATKVTARPRLELRGEEVDAINIPDPIAPKIFISVSGWDRMESTPHRRIFLAFHEYLGILGVDDSNYQISSRLDRAKVCERRPEVRKEIENELKKSCYRIIPDDLKYVAGIYLSNSSVDAIAPQDFLGMNLRNLQFSNTSPKSVDLGVISRMTNLDFLNMGATAPIWEDCSFLRGLDKLGTLWISDSGYFRDPALFRPMKKIPNGCFVNLPKDSLSSLIVAIDGAGSDYQGFLRGLRFSPKNGSLVIDGVNLSKLSATELADIQGLKAVYFTAYDRSLTKEFLAEVSKVVGFDCKFAEQTAVKQEAYCYPKQ